MRKIKNIAINLILILISGGIVFCLAEYAFQKTIFSDNKSFQKYRNPGDYARDWDEDYWKLYRIWGNTNEMKSNPLFGWSYNFFETTFFHPQIEFIGKKRPVLLYGDSFSACIDKTAGYCFQDWLNKDSAFAKENFLLNYAIGAHGVDQIYTVMKNTYSNYYKPLVIFSFMTLDLDRSVLSFREGQKPFYKFDENGNLVFDQSRYIPSQNIYLEKYPPRIKSYLWRKFLFSNLNFLPEKVTQYFTGETQARDYAKKLNAAIIKDAFKILRNSKTDFIVMVFPCHDDFFIPEKDNWRISFIKNLFAEEKVPYLWLKDIAQSDISKDSLLVDNYLVKGNGHPTILYNKLVSMEMKKNVLEQESIHTQSYLNERREGKYLNQLDEIIEKIKSDSNELEKIKPLAIEKHITLEQMIVKHAIYLYSVKYENYH